MTRMQRMRRRPPQVLTCRSLPTVQQEKLQHCKKEYRFSILLHFLRITLPNEVIQYEPIPSLQYSLMCASPARSESFSGCWHDLISGPERAYRETASEETCRTQHVQPWQKDLRVHHGTRQIMLSLTPPSAEGPSTALQRLPHLRQALSAYHMRCRIQSLPLLHGCAGL